MNIFFWSCREHFQLLIEVIVIIHQIRLKCFFSSFLDNFSILMIFRNYLISFLRTRFRFNVIVTRQLRRSMRWLWCCVSSSLRWLWLILRLRGWNRIDQLLIKLNFIWEHFLFFWLEKWNIFGRNLFRLINIYGFVMIIKILQACF